MKQRYLFYHKEINRFVYIVLYNRIKSGVWWFYSLYTIWEIGATVPKGEELDMACTKNRFGYICVLFCFFNILYHLKRRRRHSIGFLSHTNIRILKSQEVPFSSFGIGGIFFHSLLPLSTLWGKRLREDHRGHRKAWTPYHESKKKTTRLDGPTHTHIHKLNHTPTRSQKLSLDLFLFVTV